MLGHEAKQKRKALGAGLPEIAAKMSMSPERLFQFEENLIKDEEVLGGVAEKVDGFFSALQTINAKNLNDSQAKIATLVDSLKNLLLTKNMRYGDSALNPICIFTKHLAGTKEESSEQSSNSILIRLDDKLSRVKNGERLRKNDLADLMGYLALLCISYDFLTFDDLVD